MSQYDQSPSKEKLIQQITEQSVQQLFEQLEAKNKDSEAKTFWFGISGSWRKTNEKVEQAVRNAVREIIEKGGGIVTGGALNVDYFATDEVLKIDPTAEHIKVFLPVVLDLYAAHYRKRAVEGVISAEQAEQLIEQLTKLKNANPAALIEHPENQVIDQKTYFERNTEVANASDALIGFQVNESEGVADTLIKAHQQGKPVSKLSYHID